jgi:hypothetical protein
LAGGWGDSIKIAAIAYQTTSDTKPSEVVFHQADTAMNIRRTPASAGPLIAAPPAIDHNGGILQVQVNFKSSRRKTS